MRAAIDARVPKNTPWMAQRCGGWIAVRPATRVALFVLGVLVAGLTAAVLSLAHVPGYLWVAGLLSVAAAEWLVVGRRLFGAGIEEALEAAGLAMMAWQLLDGGVELFDLRSSLLMTVVLVVVGFRFLNPLFLTLSAVAWSCAIGAAGAHIPGPHLVNSTLASVSCLALGAVALALGGRHYRRPSSDRMLDWLVVAMPLCGYLWVADRFVAGPWNGFRHVPVLVLLPWGVALLVVGIRRRAHAPLLAFMVCVACVAYELRNLTGLSLQARLMVWGGAALCVTLALGRYLRTPRGGITSGELDAGGATSAVLEMAGVGGLVPQPVHAVGAEFKGGGGTFGGGGASGGY